MVLDLESINSHLEHLRGYVSDLKKYKESFSLNELEKDHDKQYMVLYPLITAIQSCIDIANHIIAEKSFRRAEDNTDVFQVLIEEEILSKESGKRFMEMARFRNLLVHLYLKIDVRKVYDILQNNLDDFSKFENIIVDIIEKEANAST